jgi:hypothetical protein
MSGSEADLLALMLADREVQKKRHVDQAAVDFETAGPRPRPPQSDPTDDKINEAFKRATTV